ncbi:MAG TPA: cell division protein FtsL [Burkholderiales bacterium]|jgi:cell division protein FtsL|nr:cell division protein FtsL [Burkholderiales bacterium]
MARLNLVLLAVLVACALGLVTSQHQARKRWAELEREQARAQQLEVEFGQLQLEASTWATPARVEQVARERLRMHPPGLKRLQVTDTRTGAAQ